MYRRIFLHIALCLSLLFLLVRCGSVSATPAPPNATQGNLSSDHFTMHSVMSVDLGTNTATLPLHKGTSNGTTVWFVITDVSDQTIAQQLGVNFAPRLKNADTGCPGCIQQVQSTAPILGQGDVQFPGKVDFSPTRMLV